MNARCDLRPLAFVSWRHSDLPPSLPLPDGWWGRLKEEHCRTPSRRSGCHQQWASWREPQTTWPVPQALPIPRKLSVCASLSGGVVLGPSCPGASEVRISLLLCAWSQDSGEVKMLFLPGLCQGKIPSGAHSLDEH